MQDLVLTYSWADCEDYDDGEVMTAHAGDEAVGSVTVRAPSPRCFVIGRLYVEPLWRRRRVARQIMEHIAGSFDVSLWLFADPYMPFPGYEEGPPREVLVEFYRSLGYVHARDTNGRPAMVLRRAG